MALDTGCHCVRPISAFLVEGSWRIGSQLSASEQAAQDNYLPFLSEQGDIGFSVENRTPAPSLAAGGTFGAEILETIEDVVRPGSRTFGFRPRTPFGCPRLGIAQRLIDGGATAALSGEAAQRQGWPGQRERTGLPGAPRPSALGGGCRCQVAMD